MKFKFIIKKLIKLNIKGSSRVGSTWLDLLWAQVRAHFLARPWTWVKFKQVKHKQENLLRLDSFAQVDLVISSQSLSSQLTSFGYKQGLAVIKKGLAPQPGH